MMLDYWIDEAEWQEKRAEVLNAELTALMKDYVPRTRYNACNADWLAAQNERTRIAGVAKEEIDRFASRVAELEEERDAWCGDAGAMQELLQRRAKRLAESSTVPQVHRRCLHPSACREQHGYCPECHSSMYP